MLIISSGLNVPNLLYDVVPTRYRSSNFEHQRRRKKTEAGRVSTQINFTQRNSTLHAGTQQNDNSYFVKPYQSWAEF